MKYEVTYVHVIERTITALVEAHSEDEAIEKAQHGDVLNSDEDEAPEEGIEIKDETATLIEE
jgi:hypothetical protein